MIEKTFLKKEAFRFGWQMMKAHLGFWVGLILLGVALNALPELGRWQTAESAPLLTLFWSLAGYLLQLIIQMGVLRITLTFVDGGRPRYGDLFGDLARFSRFVLGNLLYLLIIIAGSILMVVPGLVWALKYQFVPFLIVDRGVGVAEAFRESGRLTRGSKWNLAAFFLLAAGINLLGFLALAIGLFTTLPATLLAWAFVYRQLLSRSSAETAETPGADRPAGRRAGVAIVLSLLVPGMGQMYNGQGKKGLAFFFLFYLGGVLIILAGMAGPVSPVNVVGWLLLFLVLVLAPAAEAWRTARRQREEFRPRAYNRPAYYLVAYGLAMIFAALFSSGVRQVLLEAGRLSGKTMYPTLVAGDRVLVNKLGYQRSSPRRFDVVTFIYPQDRRREFTKRVIGLSGETVQIIDKKIFIDGRPLRDSHGNFFDPRSLPPSSAPRDHFGPLQIPAGHVFVLGDYRDESFDSRYWGPVPLSDVRGKVFMIYYSQDQETGRIRWERMGCAVR